MTMSAVGLPWVKLHVCVICNVCQAASKKWTDLQGICTYRIVTNSARTATYYNVLNHALQRITTYYNRSQTGL